MPTDRVFSATYQTQPRPADPTEIGRVDVQLYERVRLYAFNGADSADDILLRVTCVDGEAAFGPLDEVTLSPGTNFTRAYEVPGLILALSAGSTADGTAGGSVLLYGSRVESP